MSLEEALAEVDREFGLEGSDRAEEVGRSVACLRD